MVATRVQEVPFGNVKKPVIVLIVEMMEVVFSEADHHVYCETEHVTSGHTRGDNAAEVDVLTSRSELMSAEIPQLAEQVSQLTAVIAETSVSSVSLYHVAEGGACKV